MNLTTRFCKESACMSLFHLFDNSGVEIIVINTRRTSYSCLNCVLFSSVCSADVTRCGLFEGFSLCSFLMGFSSSSLNVLRYFYTIFVFFVIVLYYCSLLIVSLITHYRCPHYPISSVDILNRVVEVTSALEDVSTAL